MTGRLPVLIVGGGPTGLAAAAFLHANGVESMVVERRRLPSAHPRARVLNPRTMEIFRSVGLAELIMASPSPIYGNEGLVHADTLAGPERARMPTSSAEDVSRISPSYWMQIDQNQLEPLLQRYLEQVGVKVCSGHTLVALPETTDGVEAVLRDRAGQSYPVSADYLIGADGAASTVRQLCGIDCHGRGVLSDVVSIFFRADLTGPLRDRRPNAVYLNNSRVRGTLLPVDNASRWLLNVAYFPERGERPEDFTDERRMDLIRAAVGIDDLSVTLENKFTEPWQLSVLIAERTRHGRVFLAGDAAHSMPPTGAFGASTGIQDVHNLAWKLAMVLSGQAGPALLDSYPAERYPIGAETVRQATLRFDIRERKNLAEIAMDMISELPMVFGYRYLAGALVREPGDDDLTEDPRRPSGQPGTRAPYVRFGAGGSTADLFGQRFVLLAGEHGQAWLDAVATVAKQFGLAVDACRVDDGQPDDGFTAKYGLADDGATLVRPDGYVAWRARTAVDDPGTALADVFGQILCRR